MYSTDPLPVVYARTVTVLKLTWTDGISGTTTFGITMHLQLSRGWKSITYLNLHKDDLPPVKFAKYGEIVR